MSRITLDLRFAVTPEPEPPQQPSSLWTLDDIDLYGKSRQEQNNGKVPLPATIRCKVSDGFYFRKDLQFFVFDIMCRYAPNEPIAEVKETFRKIFRSDGWTTNKFGTDWCTDYINGRNLGAEDPKWQTVITSHNTLDFLKAENYKGKPCWRFRSLDASKSYGDLMIDVERYPNCIYTPTVSGFDSITGNRFVRPFGFLNGNLRVPILTWQLEYNWIEQFEARK